MIPVPSSMNFLNNEYDIEVQFEVVTATLEKAEILVEGLFMNVDVGFDSKYFRISCNKKEINANICFNKRNGATDRDEYFDMELFDERYSRGTHQRMDGQLPFVAQQVRYHGRKLERVQLEFIVIALKKFKKKKNKKV